MAANYREPNWSFDGTTSEQTNLVLADKLTLHQAQVFNLMPPEKKITLSILPPFNELKEVKKIALEHKLFSMLKV